jgi:hypothetical protein
MKRKKKAHGTVLGLGLAKREIRRTYSVAEEDESDPTIAEHQKIKHLLL